MAWVTRRTFRNVNVSLMIARQPEVPNWIIRGRPGAPSEPGWLRSPSGGSNVARAERCFKAILAPDAALPWPGSGLAARTARAAGGVCYASSALRGYDRRRAGGIMSGHVLVLTTVASEEEGLAIAREVVSRRLAACVNITSPVRSVYRWK